MSIYKDAQKQLEKGKRWLITTALKKVAKHYMPGLLSALGAVLVAHNVGWIDVQGTTIIIHAEDGIQWLIAWAFGTTVAVGVSANKAKFEKRTPPPLYIADSHKDQECDHDVN